MTDDPTREKLELADEATKLVYIKRWRTIVKLPAKYADEIVEALRASVAADSRMGEREQIAIFLLNRDEGGNSIEWATKFFHAAKDDKHEGDCSLAEHPAPFTCSRCVADGVLRDADKIVAMFGRPLPPRDAVREALELVAAIELAIQETGSATIYEGAAKCFRAARAALAALPPAQEPEPMNISEPIRAALERHAAGEPFEVDPDEVEKLLADYDRRTMPPAQETHTDLVSRIADFVEPFCPGQNIGAAIRKNFAQENVQRFDITAQWQPIETDPGDGSFHFYGLHVVNPRHKWFEVYYLARDEVDGEMIQSSGDPFSEWSFEDFEVWSPAPVQPPPPETTVTRPDGGSQ
jgi:hypothetical protein